MSVKFGERKSVFEVEEGNLLQPKFDSNGLIPVITIDISDNQVLMHGYMNKEAFEKSISSKFAHYWSRSRKCIWKKGETRSFSVTDSGRSRTVELKILSLGKKPTSCVKYNWKMFDATNGKKLADNDYKFCNKKAMTSLLIRKIKD